MPSSTRLPVQRAGTSRASIPEALSPSGLRPNGPHPTSPACLRRRLGGSGRYEAVDLAVAEQPLPANFDQLVLISPARADLWPLRAVLDDGPIRAHPRARAVQRNRNVGHQMYPAGPLFARLRPDIAGQL